MFREWAALNRQGSFVRLFPYHARHIFVNINFLKRAWKICNFTGGGDVIIVVVVLLFVTRTVTLEKSINENLRERERRVRVETNKQKIKRKG